MNHSECSNHLINSLDLNVRKKLLSQCEMVELPLGRVLGSPGDTTEQAYFPSGSLIALMLQNKTHKELEVGLIGEEGLLGIEIMLGVNISPYHILVQGKGMAYRISSSLLLEQIAANSMLRLHLNSYIGVLMQQLAQSSICHQFHLAQERLARLLLMFHDRLHSKIFYITQNVLATMLGVRRVGVTKAAGVMQENNLIRYVRGNLEILDISGLENLACSCYKLDKQTYQTILHHSIQP